MEALAHLYLAEENENSETRELNLDGLKSKALIGAIGVASAALTLGVADQASAHCGGYGGCYYPSYYNSCYYSSCYPRYYSSYYYPSYYSNYYYPSYYSSYYPSYYSNYYYRPYYYSSYTPCYYSYFRNYYSMYYPVSPDSPDAETIATETYHNYVVGIQTKLAELGYYTGEVDGDYGSATTEAVVAYQNDQGLPADGVVGPDTGKSLGLGWSY